MLINAAAERIGSSAVQIAKAFGASVIGVCCMKNIELVPYLGADRVVDYSREDLRRARDVTSLRPTTRETAPCPSGKCVMIQVPKKMSNRPIIERIRMVVVHAATVYVHDCEHQSRRPDDRWPTDRGRKINSCDPPPLSADEDRRSDSLRRGRARPSQCNHLGPIGCRGDAELFKSSGVSATFIGVIQWPTLVLAIYQAHEDHCGAMWCFNSVAMFSLSPLTTVQRLTAF